MVLVSVSVSVTVSAESIGQFGFRFWYLNQNSGFGRTLGQTVFILFLALKSQTHCMCPFWSSTLRWLWLPFSLNFCSFFFQDLTALQKQGKINAGSWGASPRFLRIFFCLKSVWHIFWRMEISEIKPPLVLTFILILVLLFLNLKFETENRKSWNVTQETLNRAKKSPTT